YPDLVALPAITGHDVSGVVEAVGPGVTAVAPGDEVWYTPQIFEGQGSYAEYHLAAESIIGRKPAARVTSASQAVPPTRLRLAASRWLSAA
ncbi:alcohol dehydrogenase catalytic domain-containing protein, partial [Pseudomonas aeruginosa]